MDQAGHGDNDDVSSEVIGCGSRLLAARADIKDHGFARPRLRDEPVRALLVDVSPGPGGAERSLALLIRALTTIGVRCALVGTGSVRPDDHVAAGVPFFSTGSFEPLRRPGLPGGLRLLVRWVWAAWSVARALVRSRADVVHANTTAGALASVLPAWLLRRPLVWHVRDLVPLGGLGRFLGSRATAVVAVSQAVREHLIRQGIQSDKLVVVWNGAEISPAARMKSPDARGRLRVRLGFPPSAFVYVNIGRHLAWKKQELFVKAAGRMMNTYPDARFVIVGGDPAGGCGCRNKLEERIRKSGLEDRCVLLDWQDDVEAVLAGADVLVHTAAREPFGRVLIEAMATGVPIVAIRGGGPAEIIEPGRCGLLVGPDDVDALVAAMVRLKTDRALAERLRARGLERVARVFSADRVGRDVWAVYRRALGMPSNSVLEPFPAVPRVSV